MLLKFNLYDLFVLSFVQLIVSTVLVLSPARGIGTRFRWTGSRITEVLLGTVGAAGISVFACVLARALWGLPIGGRADHGNGVAGPATSRTPASSSTGTT